MNIRVVTDQISLGELHELAQETFVSMIKGVVDIEKKTVAFGGQYHMDANMVLIQNGSEQNNVWGFNLQLEQPPSDWIEYVSLINIRPLAGNRSMKIRDSVLREKMKSIVDAKIKV